MYYSVLSLPSTFYVLYYMFYHLRSTLYVLLATLFNLCSMIYHLPSKPMYVLSSTSYSRQSMLCTLWSAICPLGPCTLCSPCSASYFLWSMLYDLTIYLLPFKPIYAPTLCVLPASPFSLRSVLCDLPSGPIRLEGYWSVIIFLKIFLFFWWRLVRNHGGGLLVVVSFFVYFRHVLSLSETSGMITTNIEQHI